MTPDWPEPNQEPEPFVREVLKNSKSELESDTVPELLRKVADEIEADPDDPLNKDQIHVAILATDHRPLPNGERGALAVARLLGYTDRKEAAADLIAHLEAMMTIDEPEGEEQA